MELHNSEAVYLISSYWGANRAACCVGIKWWKGPLQKTVGRRGVSGHTSCALASSSCWWNGQCPDPTVTRGVAVQAAPSPISCPRSSRQAGCLPTCPLTHSPICLPSPLFLGRLCPPRRLGSPKASPSRGGGGGREGGEAGVWEGTPWRTAGSGSRADRQPSLLSPSSTTSKQRGAWVDATPLSFLPNTMALPTPP